MNALVLSLMLSAALPRADHDYDAHHCELFVNSLGLEMWHYGGGGYDEHVMVSYVSVNEPELVVERVGVMLNGTDVVLGEKIEPAYFRIRKTLYKVSRTDHVDYALRDFLYFADVRRADGTLDRLWLKDGARHFPWPAAYQDYPRHVVGLGSSSAAYVLEPSPVYNQRRACRD